MFNIRFAFVFVVLFGCGSLASAKDFSKDLAPLVTESTFLIVHVDLDALNLDAMYEKVVADLEPSIAACGFDQKSVKRIGKESEKLILKLKGRLKGHLANLKKKANVGGSIFFFAQLKKSKSEAETPSTSVTVYLAVPIEGRDADQRKAWQGWLDSFNSFSFELHHFERAGFDIALWGGTQTDSEDHKITLDEAKAVFQKPKPQAEQLLTEAFAVDPDAPLRGVFFYTNESISFYTDLASSIESTTMKKDTALLQSFLKLSEGFIGKTKWACCTADIDIMRFETILQANSESNARELRELTEKMYDFLPGFYMLGFQQEDNPLNAYGPFMGELIRGFYRTMLPTVEGDRLVFRVEENRYVNAVIAFYSIIFSILVPEPWE